jgi:RsfA family transcription factor
MKSSKRGWKESEELLLMEIVQSYMDKGLSKKAAFEEVSAKINRTPATCSHHYYANRNKLSISSKPSDINLEDCIRFLNDRTRKQKTLLEENKILKKEKHELLLVQKRLKERYSKLSEQQKKLRQLMSIIKEAENYSECTSKKPTIH